MRSFTLVSAFGLSLASQAIMRLPTPAESAYIQYGTNFLYVGRFNGNSGVLIGDNMVLTAGHVFPGATATVPFVINGTTYQVTNCARDPLYNGADIALGHDFTIGRITSRVLEVAPVKMYRGNAVGMPCAVVGYGLTGIGDGSASYGNGTRRGCTNIVEDNGDGPNCWWTDFDDGTAAHNGLPGSSATATTYEGHLNTGDSGGGMFVQTDEWRLIGINSFIYNYSSSTYTIFGSVSGFSKISGDNNWIETQLNTMNPGRVSGRVSLSNIQVSPLNLSARVSLHDPVTDAELDAVTEPLAIDGGWTITTALRGNYVVRVKVTTFLSESQPVNVTNGWARDLVLPTLKNGDCVSDNLVDIADYTLLAQKFDLTPASPGWDVRADLNRDNVVDIADYTILATSFDAVGH